MAQDKVPICKLMAKICQLALLYGISLAAAGDTTEHNRYRQGLGAEKFDGFAQAGMKSPDPHELSPQDQRDPLPQLQA
jgi:hypothetical protein